MSADPQLKKVVLDEHNRHRMNHKVDPLVWDDECYRYAKAWAEELANSHMIKHGGKPESMGQNLYWASDKETAADAIQAWMAEEQYYDYSRSDYTSQTGHFSQCVWKGSQRIGLAVAHGKGGGTIVVANYIPRGNVRGMFGTNVFRPTQPHKHANPHQGAGTTTKQTGNTNSIGATSTSTQTKTIIVNGQRTVVTTTTTTFPDGTQKVTVDPPEAATALGGGMGSNSRIAGSGGVPMTDMPKQFSALSVSSAPKATSTTSGGTTRTAISKKTTIVNGVKKTTITKTTTHPDGRVTEEVSYE